MARGGDSRFEAGVQGGQQFVDAYGRPVDAYGRPIDAYGRLVDQYGRVVDQYGNPVDQEFESTPQPAGASAPRRRPRSGAHLGALAITPTRVSLLIALVGSLAFLGYAITVRDPSQIPLLASGAAVLGIVFAALALSGARAAVGAGREGSGGRAFAMALSGGLASVIAFGCFGAAIVLAMVWRP